jgi:hypothetical protein
MPALKPAFASSPRRESGGRGVGGTSILMPQMRMQHSIGSPAAGVGALARGCSHRVCGIGRVQEAVCGANGLLHPYALPPRLERGQKGESSHGNDT